MTIINIQTNKALENINEINNLSNSTEIMITNIMKNAYRRSYNIFWANPINICNEAGSQAYLLFQKHVEMGQRINERDSDFIELTIPENWTVEFNQDGTVTCTYTEPVIEETLPTE